MTVSLITKGKICWADTKASIKIDNRIVKLRVNLEKKKPFEINIKKVSL